MTLSDFPAEAQDAEQRRNGQWEGHEGFALIAFVIFVVRVASDALAHGQTRPLVSRKLPAEAPFYTSTGLVACGSGQGR